MQSMKYAWWMMGVVAAASFRCAPVPPAEQPVAEHTLELLTPHAQYGPLLYAVQMAQVFPDGKTFVDAQPLRAPDGILAAYNAQHAQPGFDLAAFVKANFSTPVRKEIPPPVAIHHTLKVHLDSLWDVLQRGQDSATVHGSRIALPYPYVVPGGRFGEIYYWDSYFTMLGLAENHRVEAMEDMVKNFAYMIDTYGFIPNGSRTYFLGRSQPPFFSLMVGLLAQQQGEGVWQTYLPQLLKEHDFWMAGEETLSSGQPVTKRVVRLGEGQILNRYWDDFAGPRDESFREDILTARESGRPDTVMYKHLRAGAESGWDFSSRWLADGQTLKTIETTDIIPVDLNALLYYQETAIAEAAEKAGQIVLAEDFTTKAANRKAALLAYCWDANTGFLVDYNFVKQAPSPQLSLAAVFPLCFHMVPDSMAARVVQKIEKDFLKPGGLVPTLQHTGQQWDAPNGWAPLHWMTVWGLQNYQYDALAANIAHRWTALNLAVFKRTGKMLEKYNVEDTTLVAGGGEYPVQDGFGWTNGVYLKLSAIPSVE